MSGTRRENELKEELSILERLNTALTKQLELSKEQVKKELEITVSGGEQIAGPAEPTAGELERLAEKLELRFALTQDANLKLEAEQLRHRAAMRRLPAT